MTLRLFLQSPLNAYRTQWLDNPDFYIELAALYPRWEGIINCDNGEEITTQPKEDQEVFKLLDTEQIRWLILDGIAYRPKK